MTGRSGKTITIFLIVFSILLLSLSIIILFFFQKEREMRKETEVRLAISQENAQKLGQEVESAKKEILLITNKKKEFEEKINGLLDELDLEKGISQGLKKESLSLSRQIDTLKEESQKFQKEAVVLREKAASLEKQLAEEAVLKENLQQELEELKQKEILQANVNLNKIIVNPAQEIIDHEFLEGKILRVNAENNFIIVDLGEKDFLSSEAILEIYRSEVFLGMAQVVSVQNNMSVADLIPPLSADKVSLTDRVIVRE